MRSSKEESYLDDHFWESLLLKMIKCLLVV